MDMGLCKLSEEALNMIAQVDLSCSNEVQYNEPDNHPFLRSLINDAKTELDLLMAKEVCVCLNIVHKLDN